MVLWAVNCWTRRDQLAVEEKAPVVDDDHPVAERFHVSHVMTSEQDGGAEAAVVLVDKGADAALHGDVEADGRLVEEDHLRTVEEGGGDLAFHPFAEGEVADRLAKQIAQLQQVGKLMKNLTIVGEGDAVDGPVKLEGIRGRGCPRPTHCAAP